jgi:hypothetical protein
MGFKLEDCGRSGRMHHRFEFGLQPLNSAREMEGVPAGHLRKAVACTHVGSSQRQQTQDVCMHQEGNQWSFEGEMRGRDTGWAPASMRKRITWTDPRTVLHATTYRNQVHG